LESDSNKSQWVVELQSHWSTPIDDTTFHWLRERLSALELQGMWSQRTVLFEEFFPNTFTKPQINNNG